MIHHGHSATDTGVCPRCGTRLEAYHRPPWRARLRLTAAWALALILLAGAAALAALTARLWPAAGPAPTWTTQTIVESILPVAKITTMEASEHIILTHSDPVWGSDRWPKLLGRQFHVFQRATLAVGIDLTDWNLKDRIQINVQAGTISLEVPAPKLLYIHPDPTSFRVVPETGIVREGDLSAAEVAQLQAKLYDTFRSSSLLPELTRKAAGQFEHILAETLRPHGLTVSVIYR